MRVGLLLAGGLSSRMGGNKPLREFSGVRLLDRALLRLRPQVDKVVHSTNGNDPGFGDYALPVVQDAVGAGRGPLAGILAGLRWAEKNVGDGATVMSMPSDTPFFPRDLVSRLAGALADSAAEIAVASSNDRVHYAVGAWPVELADALEHWLRTSGSSAVRGFLETRSVATVPFAAAYEPFFNVNTPADLEVARDMEATFSP